MVGWGGGVSWGGGEELASAFTSVATGRPPSLRLAVPPQPPPKQCVPVSVVSLHPHTSLRQDVQNPRCSLLTAAPHRSPLSFRVCVCVPASACLARPVPRGRHSEQLDGRVKWWHSRVTLWPEALPRTGSCCTLAPE